MKLPQKNRLEWTVFSLSLALVLAVLGYLIYSSFWLDTGGPELIVELGQPGPTRGTRSFTLSR